MNYIDLFNNGGESQFNNNPMPKKKFAFQTHTMTPSFIESILSFIEARKKRKKNEEMLINAFKVFSNVDMSNDNAQFYTKGIGTRDISLYSKSNN